jgi:hypothetical protein
MYRVVAMVGALCLGCALVAGQVFDLPPSTFYRDPVALYSENFAIGWLSNLGAVCWFAAASVLLFTASLVAGPERTSLLAFGGVTLLLGVDDLFLVHEGVFPFIGLPGPLLIALYGAGFAAWLVICRAAIARTRWGLLATGTALLALSLALDVAYEAFDLAGQAMLVAEDALKLTGILFWAAYGVTYARSVAVAALSSPLAESPPSPVSTAWPSPTPLAAERLHPRRSRRTSGR